MSKAKHILRLAAMVGAGAALTALLGFVEHRAGKVAVREVRVDLHTSADMHFIGTDALKQEVDKATGPVIGTPVHKLDETAIEQHLRAIPSLAGADVYHTMDGVLHVRARQRQPIVRVINADGTGFYIDRDGWTMPLDPNYTPRVLVVTGQLAEPFAGHAPVNVAIGADSLPLHTHSRAIHAMARAITQDPFWNALFPQAVMDADGEITLVPSVGMMRIRIGNGNRLEQRLAKLLLFYQQGVPQADWRQYSSIDLRFNDQVVCAKRPQH
ncbi:MAG: hypothetical protein KBH07_09590 [Flavobacteriales bacterium]|nr:hypothetical protein [Flavobacteriales bacterium]MBP9079405.1 hypothetical protein [Flavobacteriales bacterium]